MQNLPPFIAMIQRGDMAQVVRAELPAREYRDRGKLSVSASIGIARHSGHPDQNISSRRGTKPCAEPRRMIATI
jgi:hypothetical protein